MDVVIEGDYVILKFMSLESVNLPFEDIDFKDFNFSWN